MRSAEVRESYENFKGAYQKFRNSLGELGFYGAALSMLKRDMRFLDKFVETLEEGEENGTGISEGLKDQGQEDQRGPTKGDSADHGNAKGGEDSLGSGVDFWPSGPGLGGAPGLPGGRRDFYAG